MASSSKKHYRNEVRMRPFVSVCNTVTAAQRNGSKHEFEISWRTIRAWTLVSMNVYKLKSTSIIIWLYSYSHTLIHIELCSQRVSHANVEKKNKSDTLTNNAHDSMLCECEFSVYSRLSHASLCCRLDVESETTTKIHSVCPEKEVMHRFCFLFYFFIILWSLQHLQLTHTHTPHALNVWYFCPISTRKHRVLFNFISFYFFRLSFHSLLSASVSVSFVIGRCCYNCYYSRLLRYTTRPAIVNEVGERDRMRERKKHFFFWVNVVTWTQLRNPIERVCVMLCMDLW